MGEQAHDSQAQQRGVALREVAARRDEGWIDVCLEAALEDPHPFPRSEGASALAGADEAEVVPRLARVLEAGAAVPPAVRWRAERLLIRREPAAALDALACELRCGEATRRARAAEALGWLGPQALDLLCQLGADPDPGLRRRAAKGLGLLDHAAAGEALAALLADPDPGVVRAALKALARLADRPGPGPDEHAAAALARLDHGDDGVRRQALLTAARLGASPGPERAAAIEGLARSAGSDGTARAAALELLAQGGLSEPLSALAAHEDEALSVGAAAALARCRGLATAELARLLERPEPGVRLASARGLAARPDDPAARAALERARADADEGVRWLAARGLAGALDARRAARHLGRARPTADSAQWPFGLPAPGAARRDRLPLALAAVSFSYNLNLGVLIRSAEAAGAAEVLLVGRDFYHRAAAMGADGWLELHRFETGAEMVAHARARGYQLVAVQQSPGAERFDRADYPPRPCLMLGSEGPGLPPRLCAEADLVVEIPQRGEIDSLNVTAAASIVLWACLGRRGWI